MADEGGQKQPSSQVLLALAEALACAATNCSSPPRTAGTATSPPARSTRGWLSGKPVIAASMAAPASPPPREDFVKAMARLARDLSEEDRNVLLALARRLAGTS